MEGAVTSQPGSNFGFGDTNGEKFPGLQALAYAKELTVKQRRPGCLELLECWEYKNKYDVVDESGSKVFFLQEESDFCSRMWCANARPLQVSFQDTEGQELLRFDRPLRCMQCCIPAFYPNYTQVLTIYHQGEELGKIREVPVCFSRKHLEVWDQNDEKIYDVTGPCCPINVCGGGVPFKIEIPGGETVGEITKKWRGFFAEALTDSDTFKIDFPGNIEVSKKALLVGATMLLDYIFFEKERVNHFLS